MFVLWCFRLWYFGCVGWCCFISAFAFGVVVIGVACRCFVYFVEFVAAVFNSVGCDCLPYCLFSLVLVSCAICYDFCLFVCCYWILFIGGLGWLV